MLSAAALGVSASGTGPEAAMKVAKQDKGWLMSRFGRLSTGQKMLFWISIWLLPLGLIAILASIDNAQENRADRAEDAHAELEIRAQRISATLARSDITISTAGVAIGANDASGLCERILQSLERGPARPLYALYDERGRPRCASPGMALPQSVPAHSGHHFKAEILPGGEALRLFVFSGSGVLQGVAEYPRIVLATLGNGAGNGGNFNLDLSQGDRHMVLREAMRRGALVRPMADGTDLAEGQLRLGIVVGGVPVTAAEILMILLPVLMWLLAALIGWLLVDRMLLRPLARMQRAVSAYRPGDRELDIPRLATPAREIGDLGEAFHRVVQTVARHEANLESAVERQTLLVREVHHRVKNNLQVVASLLNLHSRGSPNEEVAAAYASIQRRVDALAVVHRNHFAELEENKGVALKPLISELAANLRATAPASAAHMTIRLDLEAFHASQDVAVSVAFLITELVEFAMFRGAAAVTISLGGGGDRNIAVLAIESDSLRDGGPRDEILSDRFERIVIGLARQLRSKMDRDPETGRYALNIAVVDRGER
jgi:two-component sensor histidine kinase